MTKKPIYKYHLTEKRKEDIVNQFDNIFSTRIAMSEDQEARMDILRDQFPAMAFCLHRNCTPGRDLSLAITKLEESAMHAKMSILNGEV